MLERVQRQRCDRLLDELLDLPAASRAAHLAVCCPDDAVVAAEVASLLSAAESADGFLTTPARLSVSMEVDSVDVGREFGVWRTLRRVGSGGMGDVYEVERVSGEFTQRAALKLLHQSDPEQLERFQIERQILARLEHRGIARLLDGGVSSDGRPYMVMEFVDGEPITVYCARVNAGLTRRLALFAEVCDCVTFAHRNLVVHRDLKASNILVTHDGAVKLLDFGIAKLLDAQRRNITQTALAPLSPGSAAPEQFTGGNITTATDVYALGVLLFELLTGARPWNGSSGPFVGPVRQILERSAPVASHFAASQPVAPIAPKLIRGDLDAICAKALRVEPAYRYQAVETLKLDVERAQRGDPVAAREGARLYTFGRLVRRYRWVAAAVVVVVISLAGGIGVATYQGKRTAVERDIAERNAAREEAVRYGLIRMFRSVLGDHGAQPVTAKSVVDESAQRVLREYRDRPELAGPLVLALADLYGAQEDVEGAGTLLEGFLKSFGASADAAVLADARQKLANIELLRGRVSAASALLDRAELFWSRNPDKYAEERLEGLGIRAKLERARGELSAAIATSRAAIRAREALSGRNHRETAILYNSLAISLMAANRLDEALASYQNTLAIYHAIGLGDSLDAQIILANTGTLEFRTGHLREAQRLLATSIERERTLAGDSAAVAAALGYYGRVLTLRGELSQAESSLADAVAMAVRFTGSASPLTLQNQLFLGEAQFAAGIPAAARTTLSATHAAALTQYGARHVLTLRTQLALADLAAQTGDTAKARRELQTIVTGFRDLGPSASSQLARALDSMGELELASADPRAAVAALREAQQVRATAHADGWEATLARERLGEALAATGDRSEARQLLQEAVRSLEAELGTTHPETERALKAVGELGT
jgi:non-specific serine/threonine protein kinase/serine/threonine-protein kinase